MSKNSFKRQLVYMAILSAIPLMSAYGQNINADDKNGILDINEISPLPTLTESHRLVGFTYKSGNTLENAKVSVKDLFFSNEGSRIAGAYHEDMRSDPDTSTTNLIKVSGNSVALTNAGATQVNGAYVQVYRAQSTISEDNSVSYKGTVDKPVSLYGTFVSDYHKDSRPTNATTEATGNYVTVTDADLSHVRWIAGAEVNGNTNTQIISSNNQVVIKDSRIDVQAKLYYIVGATSNSVADKATLKGNKVVISDSVITGNGFIAGARTRPNGVADTIINTNNEVVLHNATVSNPIFGGVNCAGVVSTPINKGNSISASGVNTVNTIDGFDKLSLGVDSRVNEDKAVLTITSGKLDMTGRELVIADAQGATFDPTAKYKLIDAKEITNLDQDAITFSDTWVKYNGDLKLENGSLVMVDTQAHAGTASKTLAESFLGTVAFINQGAEFIADEGLRAAMASTDVGLGSFGAIHGGSSRYDTGSHVDIDGVAVVVGMTKKVNRTTVAGFFEYGEANSDSHVEGTVADGDHKYYGIGVALHHPITDNFYVDGSARLGQSKTEFSGTYAKESATYESDHLYASAHIGAGYLLPVTDRWTADVYGRYTLTYIDSDDVTLTDKSRTELHLDATTAHALRVGSRFNYQVSDVLKWYSGIAFEHVFDGDAESSVNRVQLDVPSIKGNTGILDLGVSYKPVLCTNWQFNLGAKGYVGDREGASVNFIANYAF